MADESVRGRRRAVVWAVVVGILLGIIGIAATNAMVHWSGSNDFCSNACHSMQWVAEAYRRGPHHATRTGATAGCADCHIPYHSSEPGALQYVGMLFYKAKAGTRDAIGEMWRRHGALARQHEPVGTSHDLDVDEQDPEDRKATQRVEQRLALGGRNGIQCL